MKLQYLCVFLFGAFAIASPIQGPQSKPQNSVQICLAQQTASRLLELQDQWLNWEGGLKGLVNPVSYTKRQDTGTNFEKKLRTIKATLKVAETLVNGTLGPFPVDTHLQNPTNICISHQNDSPFAQIIDAVEKVSRPFSNPIVSTLVAYLQAKHEAIGGVSSCSTQTGQIQLQNSTNSCISHQDASRLLKLAGRLMEVERELKEVIGSTPLDYYEDDNQPLLAAVRKTWNDISDDPEIEKLVFDTVFVPLFAILEALIDATAYAFAPRELFPSNGSLVLSG